MKKFKDSVKIKVFMGYFTLVILASLIIWVIFSEVIQYSRDEIDLNPSNNKFIYINDILTNLYQAEGLERNYSQTGQIKHYNDYKDLMNRISSQIDSLALMLNNPVQQMHTDSIKKLLEIKQENLQELYAIKKTNTPTARYQKGLKKIPSIKDTLDHFSKVYKNIVINSDSVYIKKKKRKFFGRLIDAFGSQKKIDSSLQVKTTRSVKIDSLIDKANPADSIVGYLTSIMSQMRDEGRIVERRLNQMEQEILANDRTITIQLRQMLSYIEKDELYATYGKVRDQQIRIQKATLLIILIGSFALISIIFFLANILRDISRSQHYRQNLEAAKAFSESLLKSKEQFMLTLTHDLKSPLNSIIGFTALMGEDSDDVVAPRHQKYLQNIANSSKHILTLITDLLDLARLETGKLTIDGVSFNLPLLMEGIVEAFIPQAQAKSIELNLVCDVSSSATYNSDPVRITQIMSNLISNAIKFTEKGKVTVHISVIESSEKLDRIQFVVTDTGIGISEDNLKRIFEEFGRVQTVEKQYEGTGLGLTITQKLVYLLKGTIKLESKPEEGSCFTIVLPLERAVDTEVSTLEITPKGQLLNREIAGKRVWLVDDDQTLLEMTTIILRSAGMEVEPFNDPQKAINSFTLGCADILITDIQMPGLGGVEVMRRIQEKNAGQIESIAISGSNSAEYEFAGFSAVIQKPFMAQTLIEIISGQLKTKLERSDSVPESSPSNGYNLEQFAAFAAGDEESYKQILVSFLTTSKQNASLFRQYLQEENKTGVSELAHKMLTLFRQMKAYHIVQLLIQLERKESVLMDEKQFFSIGNAALGKIETLLQDIHENEHVHIS